MIKRIFTPKVTCLWLGSVMGAVFILPYLMELMPGAMDQAAQKLGVDFTVILTITIFQSALLLLPVTIIGVWASRKIGLGSPIIDAWFNKTYIPFDFWRNVRLAIVSAIAVTILVIALEELLFAPAMPEILSLSAKPPTIWKAFLASFYGGITEEVYLRLFVLSLLTLGIRYISRLFSSSEDTILPIWIFIIANLGAAIIFGLAHLPATAELAPLTPLIITRALVLNGIFGLIAGFFFWRRGIEMAMIFHFSADIVLHVLWPLF